MSSTLSKTQLLKKLYENNIFVFKDITLKSGKKSPYYCDFRRLLTLPELYNDFISYIAALIKKRESKGLLKCDYICGVPMGSLPYVASLATLLGKKQLLCRDTKKTYGMKRQIEGDFELGENVLLIEDVLTTGTSVLDTREVLLNNGLKVTDIMVFFDRNQEGEVLLEHLYINMHPIYAFEELINYMDGNQLADKHHIESLRFHFDVNQKDRSGKLDDDKWLNKYTPVSGRQKPEDNQDNKDKLSELVNENRTRMRKEKTIKDIASIMSNQFNVKLINLIREKKTAVCLSLDIHLWREAKLVLDKCGPHICMVKLHSDLIADWDSNTIKELKELADKHKFFMMEDAKLIDVPHINKLKMTNTKHVIRDWADAITVHWSNYLDTRSEIEGLSIQPICVTDMNTVNDDVKLVNFDTVRELLIDTDKTTRVHNIVHQRVFKKNGNVFKMTPGVVEDSKDLRYVDNKRYRTIENAIVRDRNHVVIIGSNIINDDDSGAKCKSCATKSWYYFNMMYKNLLEYSESKSEQKKEVVQDKEEPKIVELEN